MKSIATIITYNPDLKLLTKNIEAIAPQVNCLVIIDNASSNYKEIMEVTNDYNHCRLIKNERNEGIAKAFNQAVDYAWEKGFKWLLTLDQDTTVPSNIIDAFNKYTQNGENTAIICPYLIDTNITSFNNYEKMGLKSYEFIDNCISSGSYINLRICNEVGKFDEKMFIDWVDFEYCERVRRNNSTILRINTVYILHQVGKAKKIKFFNREEVIYNHNPIRKYYYYRNRVYFARKYKIKIWKNYKYYRNLLKNFILILKEENAAKKIISALKGIKDGLFIKL
ncbi:MULTISPECIES: glycosyltransferase [unclassified Paenibacillus]|uniref:glycosyltransferase n=1 Tax=unclassified Paenibacillus TaxID=185978 RepID=UPI0019164501|nr:glycosyltransferase [Paenibacillus sp. EPM92]